MTEQPSRTTERNSLTFTTTSVDAASATVRLTGRLDAVTAPELRVELDRLTAAGHVALVVDLSEVGFVDSAGLAVLVRARRETRALAGDVVLVSPSSDAALRVFRLTQFDQVFRMLPARTV